MRKGSITPTRRLSPLVGLLFPRNSVGECLVGSLPFGAIESLPTDGIIRDAVRRGVPNDDQFLKLVPLGGNHCLELVQSSQVVRQVFDAADRHRRRNWTGGRRWGQPYPAPSQAVYHDRCPIVQAGSQRSQAVSPSWHSYRQTCQYHSHGRVGPPSGRT